MATFPSTKSTQYPAREGGGILRRIILGVRRPDHEILDEPSFVRILSLERKRTERSGKPFILMLLEGARLFEDAERSARVAAIISTISQHTRQVDTLGWYEHDAKFAVLFTELGAAEPSVAVGKIIERTTLALQQVMDPEDFHRLSITFRIFPEQPAGDSPERPDFTLYPDFSERHLPRRGARGFKRAIDVLGSSLALIFLAPVFAAIALLIKLTSSGPVLFCQERLGEYGRPFKLLKFRSMHTNNDSRVHQQYVASLIAGKGDLKQPNGNRNGAYKLTNDSRITPLGKFLRKTSLDELPQFFNVLKGEMSLVGPRPPLAYEFDLYHTWHKARVLEIKPGITGLWQVKGRSRTTFDEMVRLDLQYARSWSVWLDLKILLQTPMAVFSGDGAY